VPSIITSINTINLTAKTELPSKNLKIEKIIKIDFSDKVLILRNDSFHTIPDKNVNIKHRIKNHINLCSAKQMN